MTHTHTVSTHTLAYTYFAVFYLDCLHEHVCEGGRGTAEAMVGMTHHGSAICTSVAGHPVELSPALSESGQKENHKRGFNHERITIWRPQRLKELPDTHYT